MAHTEPLSIRQLEVFAALVEHGSFTLAARHLGLSQSTVSGHVADLERRLELRLVDRARTGVQPTAAGQALFGPASETLRGERHARMVAAELKGLLSGSLVVGGSTIPAVYLLPAWIAGFLSRHDGLDVRLRTGDSSEVIELVRQGDVDLGVVGSRPAGSGLVAFPVVQDELVLIVSPGHPFAKEKAVTAASLAEHPMVTREEGSGTRRSVDDALAALGGEVARRVCEVGSTEAVKATVRAGLGFSFVSRLAILDEEKSGALVTVAVHDLDLRRSFFAVTRKEERLSPAARAFRDELASLEVGT